MSSTVVRHFLTSRASYLAMLVVLAALFPRILTTFGAPGVVKFFHFTLAVVFLVFLFPYIWTNQTKRLLIGLAALLWTISVSGLINSAGMANVLLDFVLLAEPFLLLVLIVNQSMSASHLKHFWIVILLAMFAHTTLAYYQYYSVGHHDPDLVKGLFIEQGAGHHVAGAVALTAAVYFFSSIALIPHLLRPFISGSVAAVVILSDSKQVIAVFLLSLWALLILKIKNMRRFVQYLCLSFACAGIVALAAYTIVPSLSFWADLSRIQQGLEAKFSIVSIVTSHYRSSLNLIFGLGPGHTVGRLASLLPEYREHLDMFGATMFPVTEAAGVQRESNYLSNSKTGSSMWSPFFFWAGLWGDLGIAGCAAYLLLWYIVFREVCSNELSHYFVFTILIFGLVFSWLEEPGYMLFVTALIGLGWQQRQHEAEGYELEASTLESSASKQHA